MSDMVLLFDVFIVGTWVGIGVMIYPVRCWQKIAERWKANAQAAAVLAATWEKLAIRWQANAGEWERVARSTDPELIIRDQSVRLN